MNLKSFLFTIYYMRKFHKFKRIKYGMSMKNGSSPLQAENQTK